MGVGSLRSLAGSGGGVKEAQEESGGISPRTVISHRRGEPFLGERRDPRSSLGEHHTKEKWRQDRSSLRHGRVEAHRSCAKRVSGLVGGTVLHQSCSLTSMSRSPVAPGGQGGFLPG